MDLQLLDMLRFRLNTEIDPKLGSRSRIKGFLDSKGKGGAAKAPAADESLITASIDRSIDKSLDKSVDSSIDQAADSAPIIKLCQRMIVEAVTNRASDSHLEATTSPSACRTPCWPA
jgi:type II secretory ATPase GspE/PulE/Tfp pilus assembly ATPase PilB-like protein